MGFELTSVDYADYIKEVYHLLRRKKDYITELDSATGDGDHWANMNMGFEKLVEASSRLKAMQAADAFMEIGKIMMAVIGGSSGILYGSAYIAAAKVLEGKKAIGSQELCDVFDAMLEAIMFRGNTKRGWKTMVDCLAPVADCYKDCLEKGFDDAKMLNTVKKAAIEGAEATRDMKAVRGRASYQADKGIGHLDPGAVTMSYQITTLIDCIKNKLKYEEDLK